MRQVIGAAPRVSLEVREALFLALQRGQQGKQRDVLVDVSEIAGVEAVAIFHRAPRVGLLLTTRPACRRLRTRLADTGTLRRQRWFPSYGTLAARRSLAIRPRLRGRFGHSGGLLRSANPRLRCCRMRARGR